jgi:hypothetical protein
MEKTSDYQAKLQQHIRLIENLLPLNRWGFEQNISFVSKIRPDIKDAALRPIYPTVIYNSGYCRIKFVLDKEGYQDQLIIYYGRMHAPDDERLMNWNNENCYCWHSHDLDLALKYLDGVSPQDVAKKRWPSHGVQEFLNLGFSRDLRQPESMVRMHAAIWEFYGDRLFNLFDLRRSDLWKRYSLFVREFYDSYGRAPIVPSFDKIC